MTVVGIVCFDLLSLNDQSSGSEGQVPKWTKGADCKSVAIGFQGSNPCLPTRGRGKAEVEGEAERIRSDFIPLNLDLGLNLNKTRA